MKRISIFFTAILLLTSHLSAQNTKLSKQEIYCNENIVWAGTLYTDIVPDAADDKDWSEYIDEESELDSLFVNTSSRNLIENKTTTLQQLIIDNINDIPSYETELLKSKQIEQSVEMELYDDSHVDDYGSKGTPYPSSLFEAFRLKCFVYYLKNEKQFVIQPEAVALMRAEYDAPDKISNYTTVGWLPIEEWQKKTDISSKEITWAKRIYKDVDIKEIEVFKKEWHHEKIFTTMTDGIRKNPTNYTIYSGKDKDTKSEISKENVELIATYEEVSIQDDYPFETFYNLPYDGYEFAGLHFSMDWIWNDNNQLSIQQNTFGLLRLGWDELHDFTYLDNLFIMKTK